MDTATWTKNGAFDLHGLGQETDARGPEADFSVVVTNDNIAMEPGLTDSYRIQGTGTFVMFLNGKEVGRVEGPSPTVPSVLAAVMQPFES